MSLHDMDLSFRTILQQVSQLEKGAAIPESIVSALFGMFGPVYERALLSMRESKITKLVDQYERSIVRYESPNDTYYVYTGVYSCSCPSFKRQVLVLNEMRLCKHLIAARLAAAFNDGTMGTESIPSEQLTALYMDMSHVSITAPPTGRSVATATTAAAAADTDTSAELSADSIPHTD